jgi:hypothetical protein
VLKRSINFVGNFALSQSLSTLLAKHDSGGFSGEDGRIGREDGLTLQNEIIASLGLGLRNLLRWQTGRLIMKIPKMISRGELDEYYK